MTTPTTTPDHISLMAAGSMREALAAMERGDRVTAAAELLSIDAPSWNAIEARLTALGGSLAELLTLVRTDQTQLPAED